MFDELTKYQNIFLYIYIYMYVIYVMYICICMLYMLYIHILYMELKQVHFCGFVLFVGHKHWPTHKVFCNCYCFLANGLFIMGICCCFFFNRHLTASVAGVMWVLYCFMRRYGRVINSAFLLLLQPVIYALLNGKRRTTKMA